MNANARSQRWNIRSQIHAAGTRRLRACLCIGIVAPACGLGNPLVDEREGFEGGGGPVSCDPGSGCAPPSDDPRIQTVPAEATPVAAPCDRSVTLTSWPEIDCGTLRIRLEDEPLEADVRDALRTPGAELHRANLQIDAERPVTVVLEAARLSDVFITLRGPVHLQVVRSEDFEDVRIVGEATDAGSPRVDLDVVEASGLVLTGSKGRFEGTLAATRVVFDSARIEAQEVLLESVRANITSIDAESLSAVDVMFTRFELSAETAQLSACGMRQARIVDCGSVVIIASNLADTRLTACRQPPLRVYGSTIDRGFIDGIVELDQTFVDDARIGAVEDTEIVGWDSFVSNSSFCIHTQATRWSGGQLECVDCSDFDAEPHLPVCSRPDPETGVMGRLCPRLQEHPMCSAPHPQRTRPN